MSLNLEEELVKVRDLFGAVVGKIPHTTEEEKKQLADEVAKIGPQPEPDAETTDADVEAEIARRNAAASAKPLSEMTDEELQAELAKRQGGNGA